MLLQKYLEGAVFTFHNVFHSSERLSSTLCSPNETSIYCEKCAYLQALPGSNPMRSRP
jgi:hypothetical protein